MGKGSCPRDSATPVPWELALGKMAHPAAKTGDRAECGGHVRRGCL